MQKDHTPTLLVALLAAFCGSALCQTQPATMLVRPLARALAGGEIHEYQLALTGGEYARVVVTQLDVNLSLTVLAPGGETVAEIDNAKAAQGAEEARLVAAAAGVYRLQVRAVEKTQAGRYEIRLTEQRPAAAPDAIAAADQLTTRANALGTQGQLDAAIALAQLALAIQEKVLGPEHPETAGPLNSLGVQYRRKNDLNRAAEYLERALRAREKTLKPDDPQLITSLNNLAAVLRLKNDYARAAEFYARALTLLEKQRGPEHLDVAAGLDLLTQVYQLQGDRERALPLAQRALAIREQKLKPDDLALATSLNVAGLLELYTGAYDQAEPHFERALKIVEQQQGPESVILAALLENLATARQRKGDYPRAEPDLQRALQLREQKLKPDDPLIALSLNNLANLYLQQGTPARALPLLQRALALNEKASGPADLSVAQSLNKLATAYQESDDLAQAEPLFQRALAVYEQANALERPLAALAMNSLANLKIFRKDYAEAETLFERALAICEKTLGPQHPQLAKTLDGAALLYELKGDLPRALELRARGLAIREQNLSVMLTTGAEEQKRAYLEQNSLANEVNFTLSLHARSAPGEAQAARLALTLILQRKGRALDAMTDSLKLLRQRLNADDQALLEQLTTVNAQLAKLTLNEPRNAQARAEAQRLAAERQRLEAAISERSSQLRAQLQPVTLEAVQKLIPARAALIELAIYQPFNKNATRPSERFEAARYAAYVLTAAGPPEFADLGEVSAIDSAVSALRAALRDKHRTDVKRLARQVDELVMRPLRPLVGGARQILLAPDGALNLVPFAALVDERRRYLVSRYSFSYLTSGRDLLRLAERQPSKESATIVAVPDFGGDAGGAAAERMLKRKSLKPSADQPPATSTSTSTSTWGFAFTEVYFKPLPGAALEAAALQKLLPGAALLLNEAATETAIKQLHGPRLLHIATHGFFLSNAEMQGESQRGLLRLNLTDLTDPLLRSGLALTGANQRHSGLDDGILTALEVAALDLQGSQLVTLSACDTGVGDVKIGDGVYGLRRALVLAGAESQLMSLWPVSDKGTRDLMIAYYGLLQRGVGRGAALRQVQLQMLKQPLRAHPYYWASFIQSGAWTKLDEVP